MSALKIFMVVFGLGGLSITTWAIWAILKSHDYQRKALWVTGCIIGFVGLSINWTSTDDLYFWFGFQIPFFSILYYADSGQWLVKLGFPAIPLIALAKIHLETTGKD